MIQSLPNLKTWLEKAETAETWRDRKYLRDVLKSAPNVLQDIIDLNSPQLDNLIHRLFNHPYDSFEPREDNILECDEQTSAMDCEAMITCIVGGNGSGKTYLAAQKVVDFLARTPPPTKNTPFWVVSDTYELSMGSCWFQKLREIIPNEWIDWDNITWHLPRKGWPDTVPLKPWGDGGNNWALEFKSYDQGRAKMQAKAIGGAWFSEQFPMDIFTEVQRGARQYSYRGSFILEFTPIDPEKSTEIEAVYEQVLAKNDQFEEWQFFRLNTEEAVKAGHADQKWFNTFTSTMDEDQKEVRIKGMFAGYENQIYKSFRPSLHLTTSKGEELTELIKTFPPDVRYYRAIDWGSSESHPFVCLWGYIDGIGAWTIFDEFWTTNQEELIEDRARIIKRRMPWPNEAAYRQTYGDPSRPDLFKEFNNHGVFMSASDAAENSVNPGIDAVKSKLAIDKFTEQPKLIIYQDRCPKLAAQMMTYRWEKASNTGVNPKAARGKPLKNNDDAVDALRYMIYTEQKRGGAGHKQLHNDLKPRKFIPFQRKHA